MKLNFTPNEKEFILLRLQTLSELIQKFPLPTPGERVVLKMKGKFSPNSTTVSLGKKERAILTIILNKLLSEHNRVTSVSPEIDTIRSILLKVI